MSQYREHKTLCVCGWESHEREKGNLCNFQHFVVVVGFRQSKTEQGHFCTFHFYFCSLFFMFLLHIIYIYSESSFRVYLWPRAKHTHRLLRVLKIYKLLLYVVCWLFVNTPVFPHLSLSSRAGNYPEKYYHITTVKKKTIRFGRRNKELGIKLNVQV